MKDNNLKPVQHLLTKFTEPVKEDGIIKSEVGQERTVLGGRCWKFNGFEYVQLAPSQYPQCDTGFSFWFKIDSTATGNHTLIGGQSASSIQKVRYSNTTKNLEWWSQGTLIGNILSGVTINRWYFLECIITPSIITFKVDGVETINADMTANLNRTSGCLGAYAYGQEFFKGCIFDVKVVFTNTPYHFKTEEGSGVVAYNSLDSTLNGTITLGGTTPSAFHYKGADVPYSYVDSEGYSIDVAANATNVIINGGFDTADNWTITDSTLCRIINGQYEHDWLDPYPIMILKQDNVLVVDKHYKLTFDLIDYKSYSGAYFQITSTQFNTNHITRNSTTPQRVEIQFKANNTTFYLTHSGKAFGGKIDNISVVGMDITVPAKNETHDVLGKPLMYKGAAKLNAQLKQSSRFDCNTNASVDFGDVPALNLQTVIISFWWRVESWTRTVFSLQGDQPRGTAPITGYQLICNSGGLIFKSNSGAITDSTFYTRHPHTNRELMHLTLVRYEASAGVFRYQIYVNGTLTVEGMNIGGSNEPVIFGNQTRFNQISYTGAFWNFQVAPYSEANLQTALKGEVCKDAVFHVPCSEGKGRFLSELKGGKHGIVVPNGAAENTWWGVQDNYHYNEVNGYRFDELVFDMANCPLSEVGQGGAGIASITKDATTNVLTVNYTTTGGLVEFGFGASDTNLRVDGGGSYRIEIDYEYIGGVPTYDWLMLRTTAAGFELSQRGSIGKTVGRFQKTLYLNYTDNSRMNIKGLVCFRVDAPATPAITQMKIYSLKVYNNAFIPATNFNKDILNKPLTHLGTKYTNKLSPVAKVDLNPFNTPLLPRASSVDITSALPEGSNTKQGGEIITIGKVESYAGYFNGTNNVVEVAKYDTSYQVNDFEFSAVIKPETFNNIIFGNQRCDTSGGGTGFWVELNTNGKIRFYSMGSNNANHAYYILEFDKSITLNNFYHIQMKRVLNTQTFECIINGEPVSYTIVQNPLLMWQNINYTNIGTYSVNIRTSIGNRAASNTVDVYAGGTFFKGVICGVRLKALNTDGSFNSDVINIPLTEGGLQNVYNVAKNTVALVKPSNTTTFITKQKHYHYSKVWGERTEPKVTVLGKDIVFNAYQTDWQINGNDLEYISSTTNGTYGFGNNSGPATTLQIAPRFAGIWKATISFTLSGTPTVYWRWNNVPQPDGTRIGAAQFSRSTSGSITSEAWVDEISYLSFHFPTLGTKIHSITLELIPTPCKPNTFTTVSGLPATNLSEVQGIGREILKANNITGSNLY